MDEKETPRSCYEARSRVRLPVSIILPHLRNRLSHNQLLCKCRCLFSSSPAFLRHHQHCTKTRFQASLIFPCPVRIIPSHCLSTIACISQHHFSGFSSVLLLCKWAVQTLVFASQLIHYALVLLDFPMLTGMTDGPLEPSAGQTM